VGKTQAIPLPKWKVRNKSHRKEVENKHSRPFYELHCSKQNSNKLKSTKAHPDYDKQKVQPVFFLKLVGLFRL
jgi:hypothetical protein